KDCSGYRVTLRLFDVAKAQEVPPSPWKQCISTSTATSSAKTWSETTYGKIAGEPDSTTTTTTTNPPPSNPPSPKHNPWKTPEVAGFVAMGLTGATFAVSYLELRSTGTYPSGSVEDGKDVSGQYGVKCVGATRGGFACQHAYVLSWASGVAFAASTAFT